MYVSLGATKSEVLDSCPSDLEYYLIAHEMKRKRDDERDWILGMYIQSAVATAVEHNLAGNKARSKYVEQPLIVTQEKEKVATEAEKKKQRELLVARLQIMKFNWDMEHGKVGVENNAEHD